MQKLKPFTLVLVLYDPTKSWTLPFAFFGTFSPIAFVIALTSLIFFKREIETIFVFLGLLIQPLIISIIKKFFAQSRPLRSKYFFDDLELDHLSGGMPSNHSHFLFFLFVTIDLIVKTKNVWYRRTLTFGTLFLALCVATSRVFFEFHSTEQVVVGALFGTISGFIWRKFFQILSKSSFFKRLQHSWIGNQLYLRSISEIEDVLEFDHKKVKLN